MTDPIYAAIDLEMTGLKAGFDEIIEVGIVRCTPERVLERWSSLVRPLEMPPLRVQRMTGITPEMLADAPAWAEIEEQVRDLLDGATLLGHNIEFDAKFLRTAGVELGRLMDTLELSRIVDPMSPSHRLSDLCDRYGIVTEDAHRALADAEAARQVFMVQRQKYADLPNPARDELAQVVAGSDFFWASGEILRRWEQEQPRSDRATGPTRQPIEAGGQPDAVSLPDGSLAQLTERAFTSAQVHRYERREEQLAMARDIANSLHHGGTQIVEAGTGTGKSLAYLVPAALWALKLGRTVLISTNTINLQQQLAENDVEFARRLIAGVSDEAAAALKATVVKGRGNYLCQERLDAEVEDARSWDDPAVLARITAWRHLSMDGDRAEIRLPPEQAKLWPRFSAEETPCLIDQQCVYTNGSQAGACFIQRVRRNAQRSHIVITNHSLLLTSIFHSSTVLPESPVVIIDESHTLEDVATNLLTQEMHEAWIMEAVIKVADEVESLAEQIESKELWQLSERIRVVAEQAELTLADLFDRIAEFITHNREDRDRNEERVTLTVGARNSKDWSAIEEHWEQSTHQLSQLTTETQRVLADALASRDPEPPIPAQLLDGGSQQALIDLQDRMARMNSVVMKHSEATVAWVARERRRSELIGLHSSPISVAEALQPLWKDKRATVLTGATLATSQEDGQGFAYLRERLGIEDAEESLYGSPFDYERNARIFLPIEAPLAGDSEYDDFVAAAVKQLAVAAGGRTMVLFRSYRAMNYVAKQIGDDLDLAGLALLRQGRDGPPARMVEALQGDRRTVVFGVAALWTGVDVPGQALSQLIVSRLPFDPPTDPVLNARSNLYENPFLEFALPSAVIQFRQGIGRLIRTSSDIGAVVILDGRMLRRDYGAVFRRVLPPAPVIEAPLAQVAAEVKKFLPS